MQESNPYEAPESGFASIPLGKKLAVRLLEMRDMPYTYGAHYRQMARSYLLLFGYIGAAAGYFIWVDLPAVVMLMIGILAGTLLRDFGLARAQKKLWGFQSRLMDWDKVERAAAGEPFDTP